MRVSSFALALLMTPTLALAQDRGMALNMGRGLDNGMSVGWTFKENWTLRPTIGAGWSKQTGFQASLGSTVLRSFGYGHRVYGYVGAGVYYGSANSGVNTLGGAYQVTGANGRTNQVGGTNFSQAGNNITYVTAPAGLRARIYGNFEAFVETAYQKTLTGDFGLSQTGQFSGNSRERVGATAGITLRLQ